MKVALISLASIGAIAISSTALSQTSPEQIQQFWFSGAEISSFELSQNRYGQNHQGHAEFIFVTEPFLLDEQVKNETGKPNSSTVLKLNALRTFNTGIYSYRTMTSTFRPLDLNKFPHALKSTTSVQDWCGQAFQQFNFKDNTWKTQLRSYFENAADQNLTLPAAHLEDELWLTLRLNPQALPTGNIQVIPGAIFSRFHHKALAPSQAQAKLTKSGSKLSTYTLKYPELKRTLSIEFDTKFPHIIRKWMEQNSSGTTTATLSKRLINSNYWNLNKPKDASLRRKLNLDPTAN